MTSGEMKFALEVESVPEPEFRQLLVWALIISRTTVIVKYFTVLILCKFVAKRE
jgi:hypothetical protein